MKLQLYDYNITQNMQFSTFINVPKVDLQVYTNREELSFDYSAGHVIGLITSHWLSGIHMFSSRSY